MKQAPLVKNTEEIELKLCCGCGIVNLNIGPVMLRMTKDVMLELTDTFNRVAEELNHQAAQVEKTTPVLVEKTGKVYQFADGKFFA